MIYQRICGESGGQGCGKFAFNIVEYTVLPLFHGDNGSNNDNEDEKEEPSSVCSFVFVK